VEAGNVAVVSAFYERANRDDVAGVLELIDREMEWHWPAGMVDTGVFHGHEGMRRGLGQWRESWADFRLEPKELIERDDEVLAIVHYVGTGRDSGVPLEADVAHLWELRNGKVVGLRMFGTVEKARQRFLAGDRP
jgi:hypothetical protein